MAHNVRLNSTTRELQHVTWYKNALVCDGINLVKTKTASIL